MAKGKTKKTPSPLTPEQVIRIRIHRLAGREEIGSFITKLIWMILLLVLLFGKVFGIAPMRNNDMSPRISAGDLMLYYRLEKNYHNSDIVVFEKEGKQYTGRVVATGGNQVEITEDSHLRVNNSLIVETDIFYPTPRYGDEIAYPLVLRENEYFVLCDYRDGAKDSRYFGAVNGSEIKGKVIAVIRRSNL